MTRSVSYPLITGSYGIQISLAFILAHITVLKFGLHDDKVPVAKYLGSGVFSQPLLVYGSGLKTTFYAYHPNLPISDGIPTPPEDPGVSGGHFDYDIFYYGNITTTTIDVPTEEYMTTILCKKPKDIAKVLDTDTNKCTDGNAVPVLPDDYSYLTDYSVGAICKDDNDINKIEYWNTLTCNRMEPIEYTSGDYKKINHDHEYDDKYDVTGVNMLNASILDFNLDNAITDSTTPFKILLINQYLNPAAKLSVGGADYENVKTYGNLASQTSAETLLSELPVYTRDDISTFIFNLPLDAFVSKDWWGDGGDIRAGLIPTQTGCVNGVDTDGYQSDPGPNGERFNGAFTIQLIKADTPYEQLEFNGPDVRYGWRVKMPNFKDYVLAEYTAFWHHPNGECYHDPDWVPDPPQDYDFKQGADDPVLGSADPKDGIFGSGLATINDVTTVDGGVTTFVRTYSDDTTYTRTDTLNDDGSITVVSTFRDGTEETVIVIPGTGGSAGFIDPNTGSPIEDVATGFDGRQSWREILN